MSGRRNKYNAIKVRDGGFTFDSKAEHRRWLELKLLLRAGEISALDVHPKLELKIDGQLISTYTGDFSYIDRKTGGIVWEDVKSPVTVTESFKIKQRLVAICYPDIELRVVGLE